MAEIKAKIKRLNRIFCRSMACKTNVGRDAVIISIVLITLGGMMAYSSRPSSNENTQQSAIQIKQPPEQESVQKEEKSVAEIVSSINISTWTPYQNTWYGLALKYPKEWADPVTKKSIAGVDWEEQIQFRMKQSEESNPFGGFDVVIYSVAEVKEISKTEEYPKLKNAELIFNSECATLGGHLLETGDYPAEEVYVPAGDACYNATLFFSNTREAYIYNIVPRLKEGAGLSGNPAEEIATHMPEFLGVAATLNFIYIIRPKPVPPKPIITAPMPVSFKKENGHLVCAKNNDKPGKSKQNKGKHLDMECCIDPDEYLNPHCSY